MFMALTGREPPRANIPLYTKEELKELDRDKLLEKLKRRL